MTSENGLIARVDNLDLVLLRHTNEDPSSPTEELRTILQVWTSDRRSIVEHKLPGKDASALQDLGRHSLRFVVLGEFSGTMAKTAAEGLWQKFHQGRALPFSSDIAVLSEVARIVIERLDLEQLAGDVDRFRYRLILREYTEPPPSQAAPSQSQEAEENVEEQTENAASSVNYVTGKVLDAENRPVKDVKVIIKGDQGEIEATTDENGVYRSDNLEPGTYEVRYDAPGYEDQKRKVEVRAGEREAGAGEGAGEGEAGAGEGGGKETTTAEEK